MTQQQPVFTQDDWQQVLRILDASNGIGLLNFLAGHLDRIVEDSDQRHCHPMKHPMMTLVLDHVRQLQSSAHRGERANTEIFEDALWEAGYYAGQVTWRGGEAPKVGCHTPWGRADYVEELASGVYYCSTPTHGGIFLSVERNHIIPHYLRHSDCWYEEDCNWAIPAYFFPDAFPPDDEQNNRDYIIKTFKNWNPDGWEKLTGEILGPGESFSREHRLSALPKAC